MIFYDCSTAPSPRRARIFIAEKGLEIETREISIAQGEQRAPDFLAINPRATLPVLITEAGHTLSENVAIATYLEALHPEPPLLGRNPEEKGQVAMWNAIAEGQGGMAIAEAFRNAHPAMKGRALPGPLDLDQIPELAERGLKRAAAFFELLEARLAESPYLAGDVFTLADITAYVFTDFARVIKMRPREDQPHLRAWAEKLAARPSISL
ncbi:glutathione S-transferase family protein [Rhodalgimonas zhirmunskyi]|uniref:Glutathione S-transferase n=1 Tax=Rhodalgimonas zhirmunskyi TaxID=2964767 RepID=A0AAJ1U859_9RHOB|nr:glutathione S-transferase [Rhodoalgimonas zhirmunskyi]MDQ2094580.1 glutathione S-transferase [Rhodoalgimonas zhirmunskyi]